MMLSFVKGLILFSLFFSSLPGQDYLRFQHLKTDDGLSHFRILAMYQDRTGYMWMGTPDGLNRYDGYDFKIFKNDPRDEHSISSNFVYRIFEDRQGLLWVFTGNGLNIFDPTLELFSRRYKGKDLNDEFNEPFTAIFQDQHEVFWLGTTDGDLIRFDPGSSTSKRYSVKKQLFNRLKQAQVTRIIEDSQGYLWIGSLGGGVDRFDPKTERFVHFRHESDLPTSLSDDRVSDMVMDHNDNLFIATFGGGINLLKAGSRHFTCLKGGDENAADHSINWTSSICLTPSGELWVGLSGGGLLRIPSFEKGTYSHYYHDKMIQDSLSGNAILSMVMDRSQNLWIGTHLSGVNILKPINQQFSHFYAAVEGALNNAVTALLVDQKSVLWYGTDGLLFRYQNDASPSKRLTSYQWLYKDPSTISGSGISSLLEDSQKRLWIGTSNYGLNLYLPESNGFQRYRHSPEDASSISDDYITCLAEDGAGRIWIGTQSWGLNCYRNETNDFKHLNHKISEPNSPGGNAICTMIRDPSNPSVLWIGYMDAGLDRFDTQGNEFSHYQRKEKKGPSSNFIQALHISHKSPQIIWAGTSGSGLNRLDTRTGEWTYIMEREGLCNNTVCGILEDDDGMLWISTNNGISKINPATLEIRNFYKEDGLPSDGFNLGAAYRSKNGLLHFGSQQGIIFFNPKQIIENHQIPPVIISDVLVLGRVLERNRWKGQPLKLRYNENFFSISFSALDFNSAQKNKYAYRLEGFQDDWVNLSSTQRTASFTNVPPGKYRFHVKCSNNHGLWNEEGVVLSIQITPPFWGTWWFRIFLILLAGSVLFKLHKMRLKRVESLLKRNNMINELCINYGISKREKEILDLVLQGKSNKDIEEELYISLGTVKNHLYKIFQKVEVKNRNELFLKFKVI